MGLLIDEIFLRKELEIFVEQKDKFVGVIRMKFRDLEKWII